MSLVCQCYGCYPIMFALPSNRNNYKKMELVISNNHVQSLTFEIIFSKILMGFLHVVPCIIRVIYAEL